MNKIRTFFTVVVIMAAFSGCNDSNFDEMNIQQLPQATAPSNGDSGSGGGTNLPCEGC